MFVESVVSPRSTAFAYRGTRVTYAHAWRMETLVTDYGLLVGEIACRPEGAGVVDGAQLSTGVDLWEAFMLLSLHPACH